MKTMKNILPLMILIILMWSCSGITNKEKQPLEVYENDATPTISLESGWQCNDPNRVDIFNIGLTSGLLVNKRDLMVDGQILLADPKRQELIDFLELGIGKGYSLSENRKWLITIQVNENGDNEVWLVNLETISPKMYFQGSNMTSAHWLSNGQLLLIGIPDKYGELVGPDAYKTVPLKIIDPDSGWEIDLSIPEYNGNEHFQYLGITVGTGEKQFSFFEDLDTPLRFLVFDHYSGKFFPVFSELLAKDAQAFANTKVYAYQGNIEVVSPTAQGVEIYSWDYETKIEKKQKLLLPVNFLPASGVSRIGTLLFLTYYDAQKDDLPRLFIISTETGDIGEICISLSSAIMKILPSPDGNFFALELSDGNVFVLDLPDSEIAILPGYSLIGWFDE